MRRLQNALNSVLKSRHAIKTERLEINRTFVNKTYLNTLPQKCTPKKSQFTKNQYLVFRFRTENHGQHSLPGWEWQDFFDVCSL